MRIQWRERNLAERWNEGGRKRRRFWHEIRIHDATSVVIAPDPGHICTANSSFVVKQRMIPSPGKFQLYLFTGGIKINERLTAIYGKITREAELVKIHATSVRLFVKLAILYSVCKRRGSRTPDPIDQFSFSFFSSSRRINNPSFIYVGQFLLYSKR